jgi:hypothetical protein
VRLSLAGGDSGLRVPRHEHAGAEDRVILILVRLSLAGGDPGVLVPHHGHAGADDRFIVILVRLSLQVEILVCGSPTMDMLELKKVTVYDGYKPNDDTIIFFWEVRKYVLLRLHIPDS